MMDSSPPGIDDRAMIALVRRALALQQVDVQLPVQTEPELHAKRRRRGFVFRRCRPAQEDRPVAGLRAHLQASNLLLPGLGQPGDQQARCVRLDELLGHPQPFAPAPRPESRRDGARRGRRTSAPAGEATSAGRPRRCCRRGQRPGAWPARASAIRRRSVAAAGFRSGNGMATRRREAPHPALRSRWKSPR